MNFNWLKIEELVKQNYISKVTDKETNFSIYNYTNKTQYENFWCEETLNCRGLIVDQNKNIIALPFPKMFLWLQEGRRSSLQSHIVTVTEKVDGFLCLLFRKNGKHVISTRGTFFSPQAEWATKYLNKNYDLTGLPEELTLLFEGVNPNYRVVLDYQGKEDLVLLAARNRFTGKYLLFYPNLITLSDQYGFSLPKTYTFNKVTDIIEEMNYLPVNEEGYVAEFSDGSRFKFKGDRYLELHKLICGLTFKKVLVAHENHTLNTLYELLPDEFHPRVKSWVQEIDELFEKVHKEVDLAFEHVPKDNRKAFALWIQKNHKNIVPHLFYTLDGQYSIVDKLIYQDILKNRKDEILVEDEN